MSKSLSARADAVLAQCLTFIETDIRRSGFSSDTAVAYGQMMIALRQVIAANTPPDLEQLLEAAKAIPELRELLCRDEDQPYGLDQEDPDTDE